MTSLRTPEPSIDVGRGHSLAKHGGQHVKQVDVKNLGCGDSQGLEVPHRFIEASSGLYILE